MKEVKAKKKALRHMNIHNRMFYIFNTIFWIMVMFLTLYPLYFVVIASVSNPQALMNGKVIWKPIGATFEGYQFITTYNSLWRSYLNSFIYTISCILIANFITLTAAYAISRRSFIGKKFFNLYFLITMFFGGGLIPSFLLMRAIGLYNNVLIMLITGCFGVWNLMVARTYIQTSIPEELYEAAVLDGASHIQYFTKVVLPLSKTIIAVLSVYYGIGKWNDYFTGLVYIRDRQWLPLQTILREMLATFQVKVDPEAVQMADRLEFAEQQAEMMRLANLGKYCVMVVSTLPVVILYLFVQKYFEKGVMIGSLKG